MSEADKRLEELVESLQYMTRRVGDLALEKIEAQRKTKEAEEVIERALSLIAERGSDDASLFRELEHVLSRESSCEFCGLKPAFNPGRQIYICDNCEANACSDCSVNAEGSRLLCIGCSAS